MATPTGNDDVLLRDAAAAELLTRAAEIDAALTAGASLAELRAAGFEAGISAEAFDRAVAELKSAGRLRSEEAVESPRRRVRKPFLFAGALAVITAIVIVLTTGGEPPGPPLVEKGLVLRCLSAEEGAAVIKPLLTLRQNTMVTGVRTPRVLTVRATQAQIEQILKALEPYEGTAGSTCPTRPPLPSS